MKLKALVVIAFAGTPCLGVQLSTIETAVGHLALPVVEGSMVISPDSSRVAFMAKAGDATLLEKGVVLGNETRTSPANDSAKTVTNPIRLYLDDKAGVAYAMMTPAVFSPDSRRVAYAGKLEKAWRVVIDNKVVAQDADEMPANPIVFSADSEHVAWVMKKGEDFWLTVDTTRWPAIGASALGMLAFSPDGHHVAAVARVKTAWVLYVDGKALPPPPPAAPAGSAPDAARATTGPPTELVRFGQFYWRPDSAGLAFTGGFGGAAAGGARWQLFLQSLEGQVGFASKEYDGIIKSGPAFSADGKHMAAGVLARGKWNIATEGGEIPAGFDQIHGEGLAYYQPVAAGGNLGKEALVCLAQQNRRWQLFVNQQRLGESFDGIVQGSFLISPDRHHYAFAGIRAGRTFVIKDGEVIGTHDESGGMTFAFSPDSQHLGYAARNGGSWSACVDGTAGAGFAALAGVPIAFSPDSSRVAFIAATQQKTWHLVIGKEGELQSKAYDAFLKGSHVTWRGDGTVVTIAIQKKVATRVVAKP